MLSSRLLASILLSASLVFLSACEPQQNDNSAADKEAGSQTNQPQEQSVNKTDKPAHFIMATGSVHGAYYPIGGVICRLLNRHKHQHGVRCSVESTAGSVSNLKELREGNFDMAVAQTDWQFHAYQGSSTFEKVGPNETLRALFALESDPLAIIVKADSEANSFDDLADKVVSFGYPRALQHRIIDHLLEVKEWSNDNFSSVRQMSDYKQIAELCAGNLDASVLLTSSLGDILDQLTEGCDVKVVSIAEDDIKRVIAKYPYYRFGTVPANPPLQNESGVQSFGLGATFVADESTPAKVVYHIVKEVAENFDDFKSLHPSLQTLSLDDLPHAGITAPLHPGAARYFKEARLLK